MKQTPIVIKVPSVYFIKLPQGEWINLASVRSAEGLRQDTRLFKKRAQLCIPLLPAGLLARGCPQVEVQEEADSFVPNINHVIVRLTFDTGRSKAYCGAKAAAILEALTETAYIDKSQIAVWS